MKRNTINYSPMRDRIPMKSLNARHINSEQDEKSPSQESGDDSPEGDQKTSWFGGIVHKVSD